jgi:hypothetical protein
LPPLPIGISSVSAKSEDPSLIEVKNILKSYDLPLQKTLSAAQNCPAAQRHEYPSWDQALG